MKRLWRPFSVAALDFGLHEAFMATIFWGCSGFGASLSCYGDLFLRLLWILGFMKRLWRPFSVAALDFGLQGAVMATFFCGCFGFWSS
ncbi:MULTISPECIES: hypothetical protein [unclassified Cytobacillus]|uniref:hypothetical protein n=1 Tax=unclassified Cytobacillus TaxID=2675268 RepID=UPI00203E1560|nr:hypothetical protein [Cytobacillus sp. AMY 15.2]MCM3089886.1 hypothetical protein [Cytobacillus sp. AMY 15.2]